LMKVLMIATGCLTGSWKNMTDKLRVWITFIGASYMMPLMTYALSQKS